MRDMMRDGGYHGILEAKRPGGYARWRLRLPVTLRGIRAATKLNAWVGRQRVTGPVAVTASDLEVGPPRARLLMTFRKTSKAALLTAQNAPGEQRLAAHDRLDPTTAVGCGA